MKSLVIMIAAALAAIQLAACDRQADAGKNAAGKSADTPVADAAKTPAAPAASDPFKSSVTGQPAPGTAQAADAELSSKVKSALSNAPGIRTGALEVASRNGVVTLYGTVDAPVEKDRAAMLAMEVDGVRSVVNNLVVVKGS